MILVQLIVSIDNHYGIGNESKLLWHMQDDIDRFRSLSINYPIVMGRKTYHSIGKPLPKRRNIVLSRTIDSVDGIEICHNITEVFHTLANEKKVSIIGGSKIYTLFYPYVSDLYITRINATFPADTFFKDPFEKDAQLISTVKKNGYKFEDWKKSFISLETC